MTDLRNAAQALVDELDRKWASKGFSATEIAIFERWQVLSQALEQPDPSPACSPSLRTCAGCGRADCNGYACGHMTVTAHAPINVTTTRISGGACSLSICTCGKCAPVKIAQDPWQGFERVWR